VRTDKDEERLEWLAARQFDKGWNAGIDRATKNSMTYLAAELEKAGFADAAQYLRGRSELLQ
jgi:hypothetical protein